MIRQRLGPEIYEGVFEVVLSALKAHGLFRGQHLGIDSSVIEANARMAVAYSLLEDVIAYLPESLVVP